MKVQPSCHQARPDDRPQTDLPCRENSERLGFHALAAATTHATATSPARSAPRRRGNGMKVQVGSAVLVVRSTKHVHEGVHMTSGDRGTIVRNGLFSMRDQHANMSHLQSTSAFFAQTYEDDGQLQWPLITDPGRALDTRTKQKLLTLDDERGREKTQQKRGGIVV